MRFTIRTSSQLRFLNIYCFFLGRMAQMEQQLPLPMPDLSTLRITTAVSMLGKAYGCGQCSGKSYICLNNEAYEVNVILQRNAKKIGLFTAFT